VARVKRVASTVFDQAVEGVKGAADFVGEKVSHITS
jgi:hypothetical protein